LLRSRRGKKVGVFDEVGRIVCFLDQIAVCLRFLEQRIMAGGVAKEGIDVDEHAGTVFFQIGDQLTPLRIIILVEPPVPP
jgi:hypothetical protein